MHVVNAGGGLRFGASMHEAGDAIAARRPMMATTIMISTSVKPTTPMGLAVLMSRKSLN